MCYFEEVTMQDETEAYRRERQAELNAAAASREQLEQQYGQVWRTDELRAEFVILGFMAPYVMVRRKSDDQRGSLEFQGYPRFYFKFRADEVKST
jgi:hypothetical protein